MTTATVERSAPVEFRVSGRTLRGVALRYGEKARDRAETFEAGAFQPIGMVTLNLQHDPEREIASSAAGTLRVLDSPEALRVEADLREGSAELALVRRRALRGLSVEFRCRSERRDNGLRVVEKADLPAIGLVDSGSYRTGVELRQIEDAWLTATIPTGKRLQCECAPGECQDVEFEPGAFDGLGADSDILAVGGPFTRVLGSLRRGTLVAEETRAGLRIGLTGPTDTAAAREVIDNARTAPIYARPLLDTEGSEYVEDDPVQRFSRASVRAILIKATPNDRGHLPAEVEGVEPRQKQRRLWL